MYKNDLSMELRAKPKKKKISYFKEMQKQNNYVLKPHNNAIKVTWTNNHGNQCRKIVNPNRCFCTHSFEHHQQPLTIGPAFCTSPGCKCKFYKYVPYYDIKCMCRHSYKDHDCNSRMCKMCSKCLGFCTNWTCKCGVKYQLHQIVFQNVNKDQNNKNTNNKHNQPNQKKSCTVDIHEIIDQNQSAMSRFEDSMDARTYEMTKFDDNLNKYYHNEKKLQDYKQKQISRINQKYSANTFQKSVQNHDQYALLGINKISKPQMAREITALQLLIRPHNYSQIKLQKFLQKQYRKHEQIKIYERNLSQFVNQ